MTPDGPSLPPPADRGPAPEQRLRGHGPAWFFLPLLAAVVPAFMAWRWALAVPHADHWLVVVHPYLRWLDGASLWSVLHEQMNDSRLDAPKAVHFMLAKLTGMNTRAESLFCVALAVLSGACVIQLFRWNMPGGRLVSSGLALLCALLWLTPDQSMNWMFGVQICYMLVVLASIAVIVVLLTAWPLWLRTSLGVLFAITASHSFLNGWFAWGLGLACLAWEAWSDRTRRRNVCVAAALWLAAAGATAWEYFHGYESGVDRLHEVPLLERLSAGPGAFAEFFASLLGMPLARGWPGWSRDASLNYTFAVAPWLGLASLLLFAGALVTVWRTLLGGKGIPALPFLLLSLWGLANAGAITLARTGLAASSVFQSRYLAYTLWFHFGLVAMLAMTQGTVWKWIRRAWLAVVVTGYIVGFAAGLDQGRRDEERYRTIAGGAALRHAAPEPAFLDAVDPSKGPPMVACLDRLESLGCLHVPAIRSELVSDAKLSDDDHILGAIRTSRVVSGLPAVSLWAVDRRARTPVDVVVVSCQTDGQPERWLGMAQRRIVNSKMAVRYKIAAPEDRVGWSYSYGDGTEHGFMSAAPNPFHPKPLPKGKVTFRAYAFDLKTGAFTKLDGEAVLEIP